MFATTLRCAALTVLASMFTLTGCTATHGHIAPLTTSIPDPAGNGAIQHVAWSSDSRLLACYGFYGFDGNRPTVRRTLIIDANDGRVLHTIQDAMWPSFSPDGKRIVYAILTGKDRELYTCAIDGTDRHRLTQSPADGCSPAWSPRGDLIAFVSDRHGKRRIYTMKPDGADVRQVTTAEAADYSPEWSFDGSLITFYRELGDGLDQVYTVKPDGSNLTCITRGERHNIYPAFCRDGRLLFKRSEKGVEAGDLVAFDPATNQAIVITNRSHYARQSPDGRRIALITSGYKHNALFVASSDGTSLKKIAE